MTEQTYRKNGKWAKISGQRGKWSVAQGWNGSLKAVHVFLYPTKDFALLATRHWLND